MTLVDSSVWIDFFSGNDSAEAEFLDRILGNRPIAIGDLILTEVLQGFRRDKDYRTAKRLLSELTRLDLLGYDMAIKCAENSRRLRGQGITVRKTADVIIATFCIEHDLPLLFSDRDFQPFVDHLGLHNAAAT